MVRVLIVDDQLPFARAARAVVSAMPGFEVVGEARSGEEAITLADELGPDLVLMDIVMEGIGGIEAARQISARHQGTRTVLVSSYSADELDPAVHDCGASGFLSKNEFGTRRLRELWEDGGGH